MNVAKLENGLTPMQHAFVSAIVKGSKPIDAASVAGFSDPHNDAWRLMRLPGVVAAVHLGVQRSLIEDAPLSLAVLRTLRDDATTPHRVRADIGIKLLSLAGHVAPTTKSDGSPEKALSDMSPDELHAYIGRNQKEIERLESELAARAKDVSAPHSAPSPPIIDAKPLNYLD